MILDVTGRAMGSGKNKVILRKLYVAVRDPASVRLSFPDAMQTR